MKGGTVAPFHPLHGHGISMVSSGSRLVAIRKWDEQDERWIEERMRDRRTRQKAKRLALRDPSAPVIDAGRFSRQVPALARTLGYKIRREGPTVFGTHPMQEDLAAILLHLRETYNLIQFVNADNTRDENFAYRTSYSFAILPLVRTMIDGFYNCTALLDDPRRLRSFRISGLFRMTESIESDEKYYGQEPAWHAFLAYKRQELADRMKAHGFTQADLKDKANEWPLLGKYLGLKPDTPHKQMLRRLTLGSWKEYSSISHASFDGIVGILPYLAYDELLYERRSVVQESAERHLGVHVARAAGILLCLLTELQWFCKFDGARIDQRLSELWSDMLPVVEVREFYDFRYRTMLRKPLS